jgi:hypothetical protein
VLVVFSVAFGEPAIVSSLKNGDRFSENVNSSVYFICFWMVLLIKDSIFES